MLVKLFKNLDFKLIKNIPMLKNNTSTYVMSFYLMILEKVEFGNYQVVQTARDAIYSLMPKNMNNSNQIGCKKPSTATITQRTAPNTLINS